MTTIEKIKSRGHWFVRIHPQQYLPDRSRRLGDLEHAVRMSAVALRGWDYPHYSSQFAPTRATDYVEQSLDWEHFVEMWRAYKSGQFISLNGLWDDWRGQSTLSPAPGSWHPGQTLAVEEVVFRLTEIYEFAARWLQTLNATGSATISCTIRGLQGRNLQIGPGRFPFLSPRVSGVPEWSRVESYTMSTLFAEPRELALAPAIDLFELFTWDVGPAAIRDIQSQLRH